MTLESTAGRAAMIPFGPAPDWVPVESCALPIAERPLRLAEFDHLFTALRSVERLGAAWLQLRLVDDDGVEHLAGELTRREAQCCSFFEFATRREDRVVVLDIKVPAAQEAVLDGLALPATSAAARAAR